jgi:uncharacterized protein YciI
MEIVGKYCGYYIYFYSVCVAIVVTGDWSFRKLIIAVRHCATQPTSIAFRMPQHLNKKGNHMRLIAYFEDKEGMMAHRAQHEQDHLDYLAEHKREIPIAGGLRPESGGVFVGGLWVMEVDSFERAEELIKNDPYYAPNLRSYKLLVWGKAHEGDVIL